MTEKQIQDFLTRLDKSRRRLTQQELEALYELSAYPDSLIRSDVAALLVDHYEEKSEELLLRMTHDEDYLVRTDAVDSLCIGRKEPVLQRLVYLAGHDPEYLVRGFAVHSTYDVLVNMLGDSDNAHKMVTNILEPLLQTEETTWVQVCYYCVLYLSGRKNYLQPLLDNLDHEDYYVRNSVLETFEDILNEENEAAIEDALQYYLPFEEEENLITKMEELQLLIDENKGDHIW